MKKYILPLINQTLNTFGITIMLLHFGLYGESTIGRYIGLFTYSLSIGFITIYFLSKKQNV